MCVMTFQILGAFHGFGERGPWARLVGRCADGRSTAVTIHSVLPYFYLKLTHGLLLPDGSPNAALLEALLVDLNRHLNARCRQEHKHSFDCEGEAYGRRVYQLVKPAHIVERFDFYGFSAQPHAYARLEFTSLGAHREARWALTEVAGTPKRLPALRAHVLERVFPDRLADLQRLYRGDKGARRKGLELVLAEANIELHDQVRPKVGGRPPAC